MFLATLLALACSTVRCSDEPDVASLRFRADGTFKIVQLTDMHFGESVDKDRRTQEVQRAVLEAEKPDLVVLSGDMVSGYAWDRRNGWFEKRWKQLTEVLIELGYPWATVLGNHDDEADLTRWEIVELEKRLAPGNLSLTKMGPHDITGATNYWLDILPYKQEGERDTGLQTDQQRKRLAEVAGGGVAAGAAETDAGGAGTGSNGSSALLAGQAAAAASAGAGGSVDGDGDGGRPGARIWLLDSMDRICRGVPGWGCVGYDTLDWAREKARSLPNPTGASVLFSHIPVPEYMTVWNTETTYGQKKEPVNCPAINPGTFNMLVQMGVGAMYAGARLAMVRTARLMAGRGVPGSSCCRRVRGRSTARRG